MRFCGVYTDEKMADALDGEWWLENDSVTSNKEGDGVEDDIKKNKNLTKEREKGTKRKADDTGFKKKEARKNGKKKRKTGSSDKKRLEKKRITDEPDEVLSKPGSAEDLATMLTKSFKDKLSDSALQDIIPDAENDFYPHNVECLEPSKYLTSILPKWKMVMKKSLFMKKTGSPSLLLITSSAVRAVELNRQIKDFLDGKCKVAKLFAKHMKVEDQKKFLSKTNCQVGIGTPGRILLLIKQGVLQLESLVAVVLDWNWRDTKIKRMSDIPEIRQDLVTLFKDFLLEAVQGSPCKLALL